MNNRQFAFYLDGVYKGIGETVTKLEDSGFNMDSHPLAFLQDNISDTIFDLLGIPQEILPDPITHQSISGEEYEAKGYFCRDNLSELYLFKGIENVLEVIDKPEVVKDFQNIQELQRQLA